MLYQLLEKKLTLSQLPTPKDAKVVKELLLFISFWTCCSSCPLFYGKEKNIIKCLLPLSFAL